MHFKLSLFHMIKLLCLIGVPLDYLRTQCKILGFKNIFWLCDEPLKKTRFCLISVSGRLDMIWLLHKVLTWFQAWKSHVAGWLLQRRLYPLFQCCGVDLDIHLHTARARVTIIKFLIPLVFPIQFQPLPDEETVDRSHYIIKYCNLHQTRILEYK